MNGPELAAGLPDVPSLAETDTSGLARREAEGLGSPALAPMQYERVLAENIKPGDRVARARTHGFLEVESVTRHEKSVVIRYMTGGGRWGSMDRPRRTARWWKIV